MQFVAGYFASSISQHICVTPTCFVGDLALQLLRLPGVFIDPAGDEVPVAATETASGSAAAASGASPDSENGRVGDDATGSDAEDETATGGFDLADAGADFGADESAAGKEDTDGHGGAASFAIDKVPDCAQVRSTTELLLRVMRMIKSREVRVFKAETRPASASF